MLHRTWLAFANEKKCHHARCLRQKGFISWVNTVNFHIGDIVYLFMSDSRNVRFKTKVVAENCKREDSEFWIDLAPNDVTYKLELIDESMEKSLNESVLREHGFKGGQSLQRPLYRNEELMNYIKCIF